MTKIKRTVKVWLHAYCSAPEGWTHVETQEEAIALLETNRVEMITLDHDSGQAGRKPAGHKLVLGWIKEKICQGNFQPPFIEIHAFRGGVLDYRFVKLTPAQEMVNQIENLWFEKELSQAKKDKNFGKINLLINAGVHIGGIKDSPSSIPPLLTFSARGCSRIVKLLMDAGADIQKTYRGWTALDLAIWNDHAETAEILRSAGLKKSGPIEKNIELISAIKKNNPERVKLWIKSGADVNAMDPQGDSGLVLAVGRNRAKLVKLLIDAGAEINSQYRYRSREGTEEWSNTAVMRAVQAGCTSIVKILIDAGADVNLKGYGRTGRTTLEVAVRDGRCSIVKLLIAAGADVNGRDEHNLTTSILTEAKHNQGCRRILNKIWTR